MFYSNCQFQYFIQLGLEPENNLRPLNFAWAVEDTSLRLNLSQARKVVPLLRLQVRLVAQLEKEDRLLQEQFLSENA